MTLLFNAADAVKDMIRYDSRLEGLNGGTTGVYTNVDKRFVEWLRSRGGRIAIIGKRDGAKDYGWQVASNTLTILADFLDEHIVTD